MSSTAAESMRKTGVNVFLNRAKRPAVHHFTSGRSDPARGDVGDGFGGVIDGIENGEERV